MGVPIQIVFDCADPDRVARFWAEALGYEFPPPPEGHATWEDFLRAMGVPESEWNSKSAIVDPEGKGPRIYFQRVPEPKAVKNRVHLDISVGAGHPLEERPALIDAEVERLEKLGAKRVRSFDEQGEYWVTMLDPEGNEFDVQ
jgi:hypothetical protein